MKFMADGTTTRCRKSVRNPHDVAVRVQCERPKRHNDTTDGRHYNRTELLAWYTDGGVEVLPPIARRAPGPAPIHSWADLVSSAEQMFDGLGHKPTFEALNEIGIEPTLADRLADWWRTKAESEIEQTVAKAIEYGATDLIDIGRDLARVAGRQLDDQEAAEWGIFFYLLGKVSRWRSAIERGDRPSDDTLLDIGVYVRMAQRVRESGGWPGVKEETE